MKFTIAPLLLSSVFASKAGKLAKFPKAKAKAKAAKSAYAYGSMSASMSVGPEPPITVTGCGEIFTNQKVVLADNLECGSLVGGQQDCAVTLNGPEAEIDCNGNTLSQEATPQANYNDGPFLYGICLNNGATAINCNVQKFFGGIEVTDGGEVRSSFLTSNNIGIVALFTKDSTLTIEDT
jgi:hypothetical protein